MNINNLPIVSKKSEKAIHKLFVNNANNYSIQLFRSLLVAFAAFGVDITVVIVLTEYISIWYLISTAIGFTVGLAVNYYLSVAWAFSKRRMSSSAYEFLIFALIGVTGLLILETIIWFVTEKLAIFYLASKIIATIIVFFWNFLLRKFILFS